MAFGRLPEAWAANSGPGHRAFRCNPDCIASGFSLQSLSQQPLFSSGAYHKWRFSKSLSDHARGSGPTADRAPQILPARYPAAAGRTKKLFAYADSIYRPHPKKITRHIQLFDFDSDAQSTNKPPKTLILKGLNPARPAGLEPATDGLEIRCSIQLSYGRAETYWSGRLDLNQRPLGPKPSALPD